MSDECRFDHKATMKCVCDTHGDLATICGIAAAALQAKVEELQAAFDKAGDGPHLHLGCQRRERALEARVRELERPLGAEASRALLSDYPNLRAIIDGTVSGSIAEWPQMRVELLRFLGQYCDRVYRAEATVKKALEILKRSRLHSSIQEMFRCIDEAAAALAASGEEKP